MRALTILLLIAAFSPSSHASEAPLAPAQFDVASYRAWLEALRTPVSPFFDFMFAWNKEQDSKPLPAAVQTDPDHLVVSVDRPLQETISLEDSGDIPESVTVGLESYGILDAPISQALETVLFRSGKPVGAAGGTTYPVDSLFGLRMESLTERWGPASYYVVNHKTNGGLIDDQNDSYSMLVRPLPGNGFLVLSSFLAPSGSTDTQTSLTIVRLLPLAGGKTDYRISSRNMGQSYGMFGKEIGRRNFGFNLSRIRSGQLEFYSQLKSLKTTGSIPERRH